jgi:hypothetical protein
LARRESGQRAQRIAEKAGNFSSAMENLPMEIYQYAIILRCRNIGAR